MLARGILLTVILLASVTIVISIDYAYAQSQNNQFYSPRQPNEPYTKTVHVLPIQSVPNSYLYSFSVCTQARGLVTPTVTVTSDIDSRTVELTQTIQPNRCYNTSTTIAAQDPSSISSSLPQPNFNNRLLELEQSIKETKKQIREVGRDIREFANNEGRMTPEHGRPGSDLREVATSIDEMQRELRSLRADLSDQRREYNWILSQRLAFG